MLRRLLRCKDEIVLASRRNTSLALHCLDGDEWSQIEQLDKLFTPFERAIHFLEGDRYVTFSLVLLRLYGLKKVFQPAKPPTIESKFTKDLKAYLLNQLMD